MKINCLIVDDEYPARILLTEYIKKHPRLDLKGTCKNPPEAMEALQQENIDIMFLDIQMPELTGIEFLQTLRKKPEVILTTAYPEYALEGYALDVTDYLLKPFSLERFLQAVNKAIELHDLKNSAKLSIPEGPETKTEDHILVKTDSKLIRLPFQEILYIEGLKEYVSFYTSNERLISLLSLKHLEDTLPANSFQRIHKSYIVNKSKVKALYGNQVEIEGKMLPIGKSYKEEVLRGIFK